jgi:hypothetical protein
MMKSMMDGNPMMKMMLDNPAMLKMMFSIYSSNIR